MALRKNVILRSPRSGRLEGRTAIVPAADAGAQPAKEGTPLGPLPEWDLADLYPGRDSPELAGDLAALAADAAAFRDRVQGRLAELSGAELGAAVAGYERVQEKTGRIMGYAA